MKYKAHCEMVISYLENARHLEKKYITDAHGNIMCEVNDFTICQMIGAMNDYTREAYRIYQNLLNLLNEK